MQRTVLISRGLFRKFGVLDQIASSEGIHFIPFSEKRPFSDQFKQYRPSAVILDLNMPDQKALVICENLKRRSGNNVRVILVSSIDSRVLKFSADTALCDLYVQETEFNQKVSSFLRWSWIPQGEVIHEPKEERCKNKPTMNPDEDVIHTPRAERFKKNITIQYLIDNRLRFGLVINASRTGLLFQGNEKIHVETPLTLRFLAKTGLEVDIHTEVARCRVHEDLNGNKVYAIGIQFIHMDAKERTKLLESNTYRSRLVRMKEFRRQRTLRMDPLPPRILKKSATA